MTDLPWTSELSEKLMSYIQSGAPWNLQPGDSISKVTNPLADYISSLGYSKGNGND